MSDPCRPGICLARGALQPALADTHQRSRRRLHGLLPFDRQRRLHSLQVLLTSKWTVDAPRFSDCVMLGQHRRRPYKHGRHSVFWLADSGLLHLRLRFRGLEIPDADAFEKCEVPLHVPFPFLPLHPQRLLVLYSTAYPELSDGGGDHHSQCDGADSHDIFYHDAFSGSRAPEASLEQQARKRDGDCMHRRHYHDLVVLYFLC
mmetsp:Transcript_63773/g.137213  ORF Transcript_63773/g.137213 Transcript_63773/m.137213 type:complete len:203 (+) Transcript_63773:2708-3316(+)